MKNRLFFHTLVVSLIYIAGFASAQGAAFSYQGRLNGAGGTAASGLYDFEFRVYDAVVAGTQQGSIVSLSAVPVTNGLFTVSLDFDSSVFSGANRWLDVSVRPKATGGFVAFASRHQFLATPYAIRSLNVADGAINSLSIADGAVTAAKIAPGAVSQLGAPDGSPNNAVQVNPNGLIGIGTSSPAAGLDIRMSALGTNTIPKFLFEVANNSLGYTNLDSASMVSYGNMVAFRDKGSEGGPGGLTIVNAADPSAPVLLFASRVGGTFSNFQESDGMVMTSNLLALTSRSDNAVTLISLTEPTKPSILVQLRDEVGVWKDLGGVRSVAISGSLMAVAAELDKAVTLIDIANPADPADPQLRFVINKDQLGFFTIQEPIKVAMSGTLLVIASSEDHRVTLVDVSNPGNPIKQSEIVVNNGFAGMALARNLLAIETQDLNIDEVVLWDVSNAAHPAQVSSISANFGGGAEGPNSLEISGNRLMVSERDPLSNLDKISYWDISSVAQPRLIGTAKDMTFSPHHLAGLSATLVGTNVAVLGGYNNDAGFSLLSFVPQPTGILSAGWVGIGTRAPSAPLSIVGSVKVEGADFFQAQASRIQMGSFSTNNADGSIAIGFGVTASAERATALGSFTTASAGNATALGSGTSATGNASTAMGQGTVASAYTATAMGYQTVASGYYSIAMGNQTVASGDNSFSAGFATAARSYGETTLGIYSLDYTPSSLNQFNSLDRIFVIGNGSYDGSGILHRGNAMTVLKTGFIGLGSVISPSYRLELPNSGFRDGQGRANAWVTYSDVRLKKAIAPINYGLDTVLKLQPRHYEQHGGEFIDGQLNLQPEGQRQIGFIAQEVHAVVPEAVLVPSDEKRDFWSLDYQKLIPVLTKAIQELKAENDALRHRIEALEARPLNSGSALPAGPGAKAL